MVTKANVTYSKGSDTRLVVLRDGFVLVGAYARNEEKGVVTLHNARIIRQWGTDRGLAQLAIDGVQDATVLDEGGDIEAPWHAVDYTVRCTHPSWFK